MAKGLAFEAAGALPSIFIFQIELPEGHFFCQLARKPFLTEILQSASPGVCAGICCGLRLI